MKAATAEKIAEVLVDAAVAVTPTVIAKLVEILQKKNDVPNPSESRAAESKG